MGYIFTAPTPGDAAGYAVLAGRTTADAAGWAELVLAPAPETPAMDFSDGR